MSFLTTAQRAEIQTMADRYDAAVEAGKAINDQRVHAAYNAAKHLIACDDNGSTNTAFHDIPARRLVEMFAAQGAV